MKKVLQIATPAEVKTEGAGWIIQAGVAESPFGRCLIAESPRGICHLSFFQPLEYSSHWKIMEARWAEAEWLRDDQRAGELCDMIFSEGQSSSIQLLVKGTEFQIKVWQALLQVFTGQLVTYGYLAQLIGDPAAARAVGTAVGNNPVGFLIPCHRVICKTGAVGGYRWGVERKRAIQAWECLL